MPSYDAIVVLGAAVWADGVPSPSLRRRAMHAVSCYKAGAAPRIIASGGVGRFPPSEAEAIRRICVAEGVPESAIYIEDQSHTTLENIAFSARIARSFGGRRMLVVTDKYHLPRAILCFRFLDFEAAGSGPARGSGTPLYKWIYYHLREIVALPYYLFLLLRMRGQLN
jgi:uncharacterized SAM-binding protein YcdF (DUF218 family)